MSCLIERKSEYLFVVLWHGGSCQEMCGTILWVGKQKTQQFYKVPTPCLHDHHFKEEELKSAGELSNICSQIVLKCLYLARIGRPDILWSVNKLARSITKWTKACDKRISRLISYIHYTSEYKQYCHVGNTAKQCRLGLFQDSDFAGDLEDSKSTSGGTLCIFGSHTFVPIGWMCKKQNLVSHSSIESESISLDEGLRLDATPALDFWDLKTNHGREQSQRVINDLDDVDFIPSNVHSSHQEALLYVFEDNEAVIKMLIKGRSPTMRHVSRTYRVALDWLFDRINLDPKIQIKYNDTKNQLADLLTEGNFTRDEWNHLLCLFNISHFSSINQCEEMSKRTQEDAGEERVTAKSKPMMNLVSRCRVRDPNVLASTASEKTRVTPNLKVRMYLWVRLIMCSKQVRWDPQCWLAHQTPQNGTMTTSGLTERPVYIKLVVDIDMDSDRRRIGPFSKIPFIPEQSEWSIAKDAEPFSRRFNGRHW